MNAGPLLSVLALATMGVSAAAVPLIYPCYQVALPPLLDGLVAEDPAWETIPPVTGFSVLGGTYTGAKQTFAQACWDEQALYVAMTCEEPDAPLLKPCIPDGGDAWLEDSIEVFVYPAGAPQALQVVITAGGARASGDILPDLGQVEVGTKIGADTYWIEVRLPFSILGAIPRVGDRWHVAFCRNIWTTRSGGDRFTSWPPLKQRFLEPENFAALVFYGAAPSSAEVQRIGNDLNRVYRTYLITCLQSVTAQGPNYAEALRNAATDEEFRRQATNIRRRWRAINRALNDAAHIPIAELHHIVADADSLLRDSYNLKYAYLIAVLLREH
ncbi:MAG: carbohydrate-binding family 9-like protein [Candidatus Zipacnadales bacterium]